MTQKIIPLKGEIEVAGDKSISHRAIMFASLANGRSEITNFLQGADCLSTISCFQKMGIDIENHGDKIIVPGKGLRGLKDPGEILDCGNSGTTTRLISGILSGQNFSTIVTGDDSIQKRPMKRIIEPLTMMGANISSINNTGCAPLRIKGTLLHGISYSSPVASAQVKSAILLAGLYADKITTVTEPALSRNHTEIMLSSFGATIQTHDLSSSISPNPVLEAQKIHVPGDISSAAYFIAAGLLVPGSEILLKNVGINPTRDGIIRVAREMGGKLEILNEKYEGGEKTADILVKSSSLTGIEIGGNIIPTLIDEIPIIAIMAACASGTTIIKDAAELKVKESNRIKVITDNLKAMGCNIEATDDGMVIHGGTSLKGATINSHKDHRIAMSFAIASLLAEDEVTIIDSDCVSISFPNFYSTLRSLQKNN